MIPKKRVGLNRRGGRRGKKYFENNRDIIYDYLKLIEGKRGSDLIGLVCPICKSRFKKTRTYIRNKVVNKGATKICCSVECGYESLRTGIHKQCRSCEKDIVVRFSDLNENNFFLP